MEQMTVGSRIAAGGVPAAEAKTEPAGPAGGFARVLRDAVADVSRLQRDADKAIMEIQAGDAGSLHGAIIALEKADISFRTMLQVRNRLIESYQEIMRMQV